MIVTVYSHHVETVIDCSFSPLDRWYIMSLSSLDEGVAVIVVRSVVHVMVSGSDRETERLQGGGSIGLHVSSHHCSHRLVCVLSFGSHVSTIPNVFGVSLLPSPQYVIVFLHVLSVHAWDS